MIVLPLFTLTIVPRVYSLSILLAFKAHWIVLPIVVCLFLVYCFLYITLIWAIGDEDLSWYLEKDAFIYSIAFSVIAPCIRLFENGSMFVHLSSLVSLLFHFCMFAIMDGLMTYYPVLLNSCGHQDVVYAQFKVAAILLLASICGSFHLAMFSDGEHRELIGLNTNSWSHRTKSSTAKMAEFEFLCTVGHVCG